MSDQPRAPLELDAEMIAAYIDKRLSPEQRAEVEARLASDPDAHALLVETVKALDGMGEPAAKAAPAVASRTRWMVLAGGLAAAAALVLAVRLQSGDPLDRPVTGLVSAVGEARYTEARLTGGFQFGPLQPVVRSGSTDLSRQNLALVAAAAEAREAAERDRTTAKLNAWGVAQVLLREYDGAVATLREAVALDPSPRIQSNLAAALLARGMSGGGAADLQSALDAADAALVIMPNLAEALYNRALALEELKRGSETDAAWRAYLANAGRDGWAAAARARLTP